MNSKNFVKDILNKNFSKKYKKLFELEPGEEDSKGRVFLKWKIYDNNNQYLFSSGDVDEVKETIQFNKNYRVTRLFKKSSENKYKELLNKVDEQISNIENSCADQECDFNSKYNAKMHKTSVKILSEVFQILTELYSK